MNKQYYGYAENDLREIPESLHIPDWENDEKYMRSNYEWHNRNSFEEDMKEFEAALSSQTPIYHNGLYKPGQIVPGDKVEVIEEWDHREGRTYRLIAIEKKAEKGSEIVEGNKLIAAFMGSKGIVQKQKGLGHGQKMYKGVVPNSPQLSTNVLEYHTSWEWIIPVIKKIKDYLQNMPERPSKNHCCQGDWLEVDIQCALWELDIEKTWKAVIAFIKWYNSQPPTNKINKP